MASGEDKNLEPFIEKKGFYYKCIICALSLNSLGQVRSHVAGENHKCRLRSRSSYEDTKSVASKVTNQSIDSSRPPLASIQSNLDPFIIICGNVYKCTCCHLTLNSKLQAENHVSGAKHKKEKSRNVNSGISEKVKSKENSDFISGFKFIDPEEIMTSVKIIKVNEPVQF